MRYKSVIWDWNGTLLNDAVVSHEILIEMAQERGIPLFSFEQYQHTHTSSLDELFSGLGFDIKTEPVKTVLSPRFWGAYSSQINKYGLHDDSVNTLQAIRSKNILQAVLSAHPHESLITDIESFRISHLFDHIQGCEAERGIGKKNYAQSVMDKLNLKKEETVLIGDTRHDAEVASFLGVECVLVSRGFESHAHLASTGIPVKATLGEVLESYL